MNRLDSVNDSEFTFAALLIVANKMDTLLERVLIRYGITAKQWFLLLVAINLAESMPTIKEAAAEMGSSHQNVKQIALKLEKKGMLRLEKDETDRRMIRLVTTEKSREFWQALEGDGIMFMKAFYEGIEPEQLSNARRFLSEVLQNLNRIEAQ